MPERTVVQWQNSYSVNVKLIDQQHQELIKMTNKLFASCLAGQQSSKSTFLEIIKAAIDYTGYHFSTEERIMERIKDKRRRVKKNIKKSIDNQRNKKTETLLVTIPSIVGV